MNKQPTRIKLHKLSRQLEVHFDGEQFLLPAEFLRVYSPSAEVKGHGPHQAVLQFGKRDVAIQHLAYAGNYALKVEFDDGHNTGIYTWNYLYELGINQQQLWQDYLHNLHSAGKSREQNTDVVKFVSF
jgi:DUF971 family protein